MPVAGGVGARAASPGSAPTAACYDWVMVEMYVWSLLAVVVAVGVLLLAGVLAPGESRDEERTGSAWTTLWHDFRAGTADARARWRTRRGRAGSPALRGSGREQARAATDGADGADGAPTRVSVLASRGTTTPGEGAAVGSSTESSTPATPTAPSTTRPARTPRTPRAAGARGAWEPLWSQEGAESNTSIDDFFEATQTSQPAYLDAAQLSDALHQLRR